MATFAQKEMLWEEMYSSVTALIERKRDPKQGFTPEAVKDIQLLAKFRDELADKSPEEIDFDEAMSFYNAIEDKYKQMPNGW